MKRRLLLLLALPALLLCGCTRQGVPVDPLRGIAASIVAGNAFDRANIALLRNNNAGLKSAGMDLRSAANAGSNPKLADVFTMALTQSAGELSALASLTKGQDREKLQNQSDERYRVALGFAPATAPEKSLDPDTLNGIGYFLAERGSTREDFEKGALFTKAAYDKWPVLTGLGSNATLISRALAPQDSYAWALFKLGRFGEARQQEEAALKTARAIAPERINAEIPYHMGEIYRVLGEKEKARAEYNAALELGPTDDLITRIQSGIHSLDAKQV